MKFLIIPCSVLFGAAAMESTWPETRSQSEWLWANLGPVIGELAADLEYAASVGTSSRAMRLSILRMFLGDRGDLGQNDLAKGVFFILVTAAAITKAKRRVVSMIGKLRQRIADGELPGALVTDVMATTAAQIVGRMPEKTEGVRAGGLPAIVNVAPAFPELTVGFRAGVQALRSMYTVINGVSVPESFVCPEFAQFWWTEESKTLVSMIDRTFCEGRAKDPKTNRGLVQNLAILEQKFRDEYGFTTPISLQVFLQGDRVTAAPVPADPGQSRCRR